jgi:hypothetical protein
MRLSLGITPRSYVPLGGAATDTDAQAFITAAGITDATQKSAVNQLVLDLKSANIWAKMKAIYPVVGGSASTHKWNLKDPRDLDAAFRLTFTTGWTHSSTGMLPNGTSAYANTNAKLISVSTALNISAGIYLRTNNTGNRYSFGAVSNAGEGTALAPKWSDNNTYFGANNSLLNGSGNFVTDTRGLFVVNKFSSNTAKLYRNGSILSTATPTTGNVAPDAFLFIAARTVIPSTVDGYDNKENAFFFFADSLTDTEVTNLTTAVNTYQTTLGRNV